MPASSPDRPKPLEQDRRQARPVALARARRFPRIEHCNKLQARIAQLLRTSMAANVAPARPPPAPQPAAPQQRGPTSRSLAWRPRRRESHAGGFSPTTRRRRREAAEHCVNGLTREVHMPMAPTWVSKAVRRPSLADSARATAQQCRHGQVFLHTSAAGCALAPQERLEAGIPNVLKSTVVTQAAPARTADTWPRRGQ